MILRFKRLSIGETYCYPYKQRALQIPTVGSDQRHAFLQEQRPWPEHPMCVRAFADSLCISPHIAIRHLMRSGPNPSILFPPLSFSLPSFPFHVSQSPPLRLAPSRENDYRHVWPSDCVPLTLEPPPGRDDPSQRPKSPYFIKYIALNPQLSIKVITPPQPPPLQRQ